MTASMDKSFVHLHIHSQYSMLDGAIRLGTLVDRVKSLQMPAVALTDHGNMFGAVQFHRACTNAGIKPILGCEVNLVADRKSSGGGLGHHLVLLVSSQEGYRNLVQLVSRGWVEGMAQGVPRIDFELLSRYRKGLVALSSCLGGHAAQEILHKGEDAGREALSRLRDCVEPGQLFVELQDHGFIEQKHVNEILVELARELELPLVATNDCHYLAREDARAQMALQCISAGVTLQEMERMHHGSEEIYVKSAEEMHALFGHLPEALDNTLRIAEMCGGAADPLSVPMLPRFPVPQGLDEAGFFRKLAEEGLEARFEELVSIGIEVDRAAYQQRLQMECDVICQMGYPGYFLIVQDFINWAKRQGIPVGPGRGSGAGSLVAYAMRITNLDPIPYGLLFERFLNPERVSMPDFDVDFCMDRRDEVIDYVRDKFGSESVGQIATFHLLKSRSVVRDVGRVMGLPPQDAGRIATLVPEPVQGKSVSIPEALQQEPRLKALYEESEEVHTLLDFAQTLEGLNRHAGMHAAGVVISEGPLWEHVPVFCPEPGTYVTQYHKDDVEAAGLVKFDFLGLKTLTVIDIATRLINQRPDRLAEPFDVDKLPLDDKATYALLQSGETTNVFQLESSGMQGLIKQLKPDCFEDIVALVALYRPGPLGSGMVEDFVQRKHGRVKVEYPHSCLERTLKETYGVIVYQEQVMQAAREMAGYSLGGADLLRRAMGKKKPEEMAKQREIFIKGSLENGHTQDDAEKVFDLMNYFAGYGFNKSHSAAYALISYQCAYLKAHFPVEFLAATLTADKEKIDKVVRTVAEARSLGITVLPPDVNESAIDFTVVYDPEPAAEPVRNRRRPVCRGGKVHDPMRPKVRFGLGAVKGVGASALHAIFDARRGDDATDPAASAADAETSHTPASSPPPRPFSDLYDFTARVDLRRVNKAVIEALIQCGAMDSVHELSQVSRAKALAAVDAAIERGKKIGADRDSGQTSLFGLLGAATDDTETVERTRIDWPSVQPWDQAEQLAREKSTLGFYISGHPLDGYLAELRRFCSAALGDLGSLPEGSEVSVGGMVEGYRERTTKNGGKIAFFSLEDPVGRVEVIVRSRAIEEARPILQSSAPVLVTGTVQFERDRNDDGDESAPQAKLLLNSVAPLVDSLRAKTKSVRVRMQVERLASSQLVELRETLLAHPGECPVILELVSQDRWSATLPAEGLAVNPTQAFMSSLERLFGHKVCELR